MLDFFRRLRQDHLSENKLSFYLIYGLGEIFLVVLGILIALQVDNWNENRKLMDLENKMLMDIRENLTATRDNLASNISYNKYTLVNYELIQNHMKDDLPYSSSLDTAFSYFSYWSEPNFTYTAYETLKTKGLDIVQNDSLKKFITKVYEQYFPFLKDELRAEWELHQSLVLPFIARHIQYINSEVARPNNYDELKTSNEFQNIMGIKMMTRRYAIQYAEGTLEQVDSLIFMIDSELDK